MKYTIKIILFGFFIVLMSCKKAKESKINNLNSINKDVVILSKDTSKTDVIVNKKENWDGDYSIKTKAISYQENHQEIDLRYYINIKGKKAILSIGAEFSEDYWCEGDYYLDINNEGIYAIGKCNEDDINDFAIKQAKNQFYIKSNRFKNKDWQILTKEK
jgi:hypothetical protein